MRRNRYPPLLTIALLVIPAVAVSEDVPREVTHGLEQHFKSIFCADAEFLTCTGILEGACSSAATNAVQSCDYSPVWSTIQKQARTDSGYKVTSAEGEKYGACVNETMQRLLHVAPEPYEQCVIARFRRLQGSLRDRARAQR